jgi:hypothetical protein
MGQCARWVSLNYSAVDSLSPMRIWNFTIQYVNWTKPLHVDHTNDRVPCTNLSAARLIETNGRLEA